MSHRFLTSLSPAAMVVAVLALVLAGAGVGYSVGTVGTSDLQNNAVTSAKVKNGTLKNADMVKQQKYVRPTLGNGIEGDCLWSDVSVTSLPGLSHVAYRRDRFGTTHLTGIATMADGPGGDAACGGAGMDSIGDFTIFTLPAAAQPAASLYRIDLSGNLMIVPGPGGLNLGGGTVIPAGAVLCADGGSSACFLDGISFETASAKVVVPRATTGVNKPITKQGRAMLRQLLQR